MQSLWLARSAALGARAVVLDVPVAGENTHVESRRDRDRWVATAQVEGFGVARVSVKLDASNQPVEWNEAYERAAAH